MKKTSLLLFCLMMLNGAFGQLTPIVDSIPMSDGKKIAADVYIPSTFSQGAVILIQTPYNRKAYRYNLPFGLGLNLDNSNYIIVVCDWRGFYGSAAAAYSGSPTGGQDGYDIVEWIATQSWSNGKIGTWGPSALGDIQYETAKQNPPHLVCICPEVAAPQTNYEDYFPNGALRTEYVQQLDTLGFGITNAIMPYPVHNVAWTYTESNTNYPSSIQVPCLIIGGWYDHNTNDIVDFFNELRTTSPIAVRDQHRLLMGPWVHGGHGVAHVGSATQGQLSYPNAANWGDSISLVYFDYHLRNIANNWDNSAYVQYYQMGTDNWNNASTWPETGSITPVQFYFHKNGLLDYTVPSTSADVLDFQYDPNDPSPTIGGSVLRSDLNQGPYDQVPDVESRNDLLIFTTDVLTQNAEMKGKATLHMKVSSDRFDTDYDVRLTDVYPDGRSMLVMDGVMRMRFRNGNSTTDTVALVPNQIYDCQFSLPYTSITFLAGHKIRVDISSSNYPRFNRNMNTDGPMYPGNNVDILVNPLVATNSVYVNNTNSSYISLPLVNYTAGIKEYTEANKKDLFIYPNPTTEQLTLQIPTSGKYAMIVYNQQGEKLMSKDEVTNMQTISVSELTKGMYFIVLQSANESFSQKFVKE